MTVWLEASRWSDDKERTIWANSGSLGSRAFEVDTKHGIARLCRPHADSRNWYFTYYHSGHCYADLGQDLVKAKAKAEKIISIGASK